MPNAERVLLDTHALLWWKSGGTRLSRAARRTIEQAQVLLVSPITCWEVATLVRLERIVLDRPVVTWVADVLAGDRVAFVPLRAATAAAAGSLDEMHGDPADRMLVATALAEAVPILSKDRSIHDFARKTPALTVRW